MWSHQAEDASAEEGAETDVVAGAEGTLAEEEMMTGTETAIQATAAHLRQRPLPLSDGSATVAVSSFSGKM